LISKRTYNPQVTLLGKILNFLKKNSRTSGYSSIYFSQPMMGIGFRLLKEMQFQVRLRFRIMI
jgi:hypothetical protein